MKRGVCEDGRYMRRMCTGVGEEHEIGWERCGEGRQEDGKGVEREDKR